MSARPFKRPEYHWAVANGYLVRCHAGGPLVWVNREGAQRTADYYRTEERMLGWRPVPLPNVSYHTP